MSSYEDYTQTSRHYDKTRQPIGIEIIIGCLSRGPAPLSQMTVADAGCGTGSYADALLDHVGRIEAVDMNPGMLKVAEQKLERGLSEGRVSLRSSRVDALPLEDASVDGVMINQVLHHLQDDPAQDFPAHRRVFEEFARVLKPGGALTVNTCSREQLQHGYWHYHLIPEAAEALRRRYAPLDALIGIFMDCGFAYEGRFAPIDAPVQGEPYFDPRGPLKKEWRDGDSVWSLVSEDELDIALSRIQALDEAGELEQYVAQSDARRRHIGQITILSASRS